MKVWVVTGVSFMPGGNVYDDIETIAVFNHQPTDSEIISHLHDKPFLLDQCSTFAWEVIE